MDIPEGIAGMLGRLREAGFTAWLTGGCVRDALMGQIPHDYDIAADALPEEIIALFGKEHCKAYGRAFGTVGVQYGDAFAEITTFRTEGDYSDSRHPSVVRFTGDIRADLARRDFTCNAMAFSPEEGLMDLFGGQDDLKSGVLRCVGVPQMRFREDALRILRGMRFMSRFGFRAEPLTHAAMLGGAHRLAAISRERIFSELCEILMGEHVTEVLLRYPAVLGVWIPEILPCVGFTQHSRHHDFAVWEHIARSVGAAPAVLPVRIAMLFHDIGKPQCFTMDAEGGHFKGHPEKSAAMADSILKRLKCSNALRRQVCLLIRYHRDIPDTMVKVRRLRMVLTDEEFTMLLQVFRADDAAKRREQEPENQRIAKARALYDRCREEGLCCRLSELAVNGEDLLALGLQGRAVGESLQALLEAVVQHQCRNGKNYLLEYYRKNLKNMEE